LEEKKRSYSREEEEVHVKRKGPPFIWRTIP
jgi:hypothetical protein